MNRNLIAFILLAVSLVGVSCDGGGSKNAGMKDGKKVELQDAKGFTITEFEGYKVIEVVNPWKDSVLLHRYILVEKDASTPRQSARRRCGSCSCFKNIVPLLGICGFA